MSVLSEPKDTASHAHKEWFISHYNEQNPGNSWNTNVDLGTTAWYLRLEKGRRHRTPVHAVDRVSLAYIKHKLGDTVVCQRQCERIIKAATAKRRKMQQRGPATTTLTPAALWMRDVVRSQMSTPVRLGVYNKRLSIVYPFPKDTFGRFFRKAARASPNVTWRETTNNVPKRSCCSCSVSVFFFSVTFCVSC